MLDIEILCIHVFERVAEVVLGIELDLQRVCIVRLSEEKGKQVEMQVQK